MDPSPSGAAIVALGQVEQDLVRLLQVAGSAIAILSGNVKDGELSDADARRTEMEAKTHEYFQVLNRVQNTLRQQIHGLIQERVIPAAPSSSSMPFHASVYGEQKELDSWVGALQAVKQGIRRISSASIVKQEEETDR
ncbi:hypothetical protein BZG36_01878 [Bifiguratus adelaidae]|uniref:Mediator of RNA polymerase II transcription subunit 11 n=1 Tax=Bifiguratus adelaidae TaxID=1938954 RepID=A0A261Y2D0_9FUNG|nr:hypothetical protein BZG36_01878 [Bifiguratus adelaidae]